MYNKDKLKDIYCNIYRNEVFTIEQTALLLGRSVKSVRRYISTGKLAAGLINDVYKTCGRFIKIFLYNELQGTNFKYDSPNLPDELKRVV